MPTIVGLSGSNKIVTNRSVSTEETGIQRYTEKFVTTTFGAGIGSNSMANEGAAIPEIYSQSTRYSFMNVDSVSVAEKPGDLAEVTVNYIGFTYPILFNWPPTLQPTISASGASPSSQSSIPQFGATNSKASARVRCFPAGQEGADWKYYPLVVEINFIDAVANEYKMLSSWRVGRTPLFPVFRGISIPPATKAPFEEKPPNPRPPEYAASLLTYLGPCLSALNITRRGIRYNEIRATFKDNWFFTTYRAA